MQCVNMQVDATAVVRLQRVGWAGCAAQAPFGILHSLLRSEVSAHMYGLPVVRAVIDLKWYAAPRMHPLFKAKRSQFDEISTSKGILLMK